MACMRGSILGVLDVHSGWLAMNPFIIGCPGYASQSTQILYGTSLITARFLNCFINLYLHPMPQCWPGNLRRILYRLLPNSLSFFKNLTSISFRLSSSFSRLFSLSSFSLSVRSSSALRWPRLSFRPSVPCLSYLPTHE